MKTELKPFWNNIFNFDWKFGLFLILLFCIPRFILVLNANQTADYKFIGLVMTIYALTPFIFLTKQGRKTIGMVKANPYSKVILAFLVGIVFSVLLYFIGEILYGDSIKNWYNYIGKSYNISESLEASQKLVMFLIFACTSMIFSPIGEELLFRGIIHSSFAVSIGDNRASVVDSIAFALTHISHFGLVYHNTEWEFLVFPAIIWVLAMFFVGRLFYFFRKYTHSIIGSIVCHAGFNLGMTYAIFYWLY